MLRVAHNPPELDTSFVGMTKQEIRNQKQETKKPQTTENLRLFYGCVYLVLRLRENQAKQQNHDVTNDRCQVRLSHINVGYFPHDRWENRTTHNSHHDKRRRALFVLAKVAKAQSKNRWEHDTHKEVKHH